MGADGLLGEDGMHRIAISMTGDSIPMPRPAPIPQPEVEDDEESMQSVFGGSEPVLTADELRALLQEQPSERE